MSVYTNKKTGRVCYAFPWESQKAPCPWNQQAYERVVIPMTDTEKRNTRKTVHIQIMRRSNLQVMREPRLRVV